MTDSCILPYVPHRTLADDLVTDIDKNILSELKDMEDRIKRHITECKREVIKELIREKQYVCK